MKQRITNVIVGLAVVAMLIFVLMAISKLESAPGVVHLDAPRIANRFEMQLWEYKCAKSYELRDLGQMGWELVLVTDGCLILKRPRGRLTAEEETYLQRMYPSER